MVLGNKKKETGRKVLGERKMPSDNKFLPVSPFDGILLVHPFKGHGDSVSFSHIFNEMDAITFTFFSISLFTLSHTSHSFLCTVNLKVNIALPFVLPSSSSSYTRFVPLYH